MATEPVRLVVTRERSVRVEVLAKPRARSSRIAGLRQGALVIHLAAPPVDGAANAELLETLASALGVPRRDLTLVRGQTARSKLVEVRGLAVDDLRSRLDRALEATC
jgi:uncharacterized protein YggU (UPF0235/DUF167 family)